MNSKCNFVPVLSSNAGSCLTPDNWQEVNTTNACWHLDSLLLKPGLDILKKITDLKQYLVWSGHLTINAVSLKENSAGVFSLRSTYDGSKIHFNFADFMELIQQLRPDAVLLPEQSVQNHPDWWMTWPDDVYPYISWRDADAVSPMRPYGIYSEAKDMFDKPPHYIFGNMSPERVRGLCAEGMRFIETNEPAEMAFWGKVYSSSGIIDITDAKYELDFEPIDNQCSCPTCIQSFTKAYLHHLLQHTPLLCQRLLIQHNIYYYNAMCA
jgi:queuine tRNA-ribosyltransferase